MEENLENHQNNYRYERKYLLKISNSGLFMKKLYLNNFEEIYSPRKVNNIYYDTINLSSLTETKEGLSNRVKYRVRWYGETFKKSNKNLELKIKSEFLNRKKSYFIGNLKFHSPITKNLKMLNNLIEENLLKVKDNFYNKTPNLLPVLYNNYFRKYFISNKLGVRITIDSELNYYSLLNGNMIFDTKELVIEIKYKRRNFFIMRDLFDLELKKKSKFETGISLTHKL
tara:strand:+ start:956 stop:1636 length:681 start_codon:yes stop_codon:yes gene_type:complete